MKNELVSIVIPVYNARKTIQQCLDSIINQTYQELEIIIIDDGSKDGTAEWIENKYREEKRITLIKQENQGPSVARNNGINRANGKYVMFVDCDDFLNEGFIDNILKDYKFNMLNGGNYNLVTKSKVIPNRRRDTSKENVYMEIVNGKIGGFIWGYLFEKSLIGTLRFNTNIRFMEDVSFLLEYCRKVAGIHFVESSIYYYVCNDLSLSKSKENVLRNIKYMNVALDQIEKFFIENRIEVSGNFIKEKKLRLVDAELGKLSQKLEIEKILEDDEFKKVIQNIKVGKNNKLFWRIYVKYILNNKFFAVLYLKLRKVLKKIKGGVQR